ncbi:hypothetical protein JR047_24185, partial [Pseudomonas stutzeri]|nr:hypothetical protein [Stutzerimonas stutzeri]
GSQLTGLAWSRGGQALGNLGYAYDNRGLVVSQTGTFSSKSLPSASIGENSFDDNQRQTRSNGQTLTYDANGNLLTYEGRVLEWNSRTELVRVSEAGEVVAEYKYDGLGRRVTKAEKGVVTSYLYDGLTAVQ